ncbi:PREDICTED: uncharacterized protein LOC109193916 [Ipomoea nil]|uniref:uncharacterized protein LOC109193916 n=1 Tax=Ipomoea nil TaxID=35883 RepID=UPI000900F572|nr:PREDICTED: uncharacterized protein LOC109193916 [Ipomoea nil]
MWLGEDICKEIVQQSWDKTMGLDVLDRIVACSRDIWVWGRNYNKDFLKRIDACKLKLESLRARTDGDGCAEYERVEKELLILLEQQHLYWKQRAKEHWWRGDDQNTKFFHNSIESEEEIGGIMVDYFREVFTAEDGEMNEVIACMRQYVKPEENARSFIDTGQLPARANESLIV